MKYEKDSLGNRMKNYENVFNNKLPCRVPIVIRVDGKTFHTLTKKWKLDPAFDTDFKNIMSYTATQLCKVIDGAKIAYIYSDEISIIARNDMTANTSPWFDNKIEKICSVTASVATAAFNSYRPAKEYSNSVKLNVLENPAIFDSRVFILPEYEINNYLIWRQQDASRNSVNSLTRTLYSHKECEFKNTSDMQEMCFQKGINWNNIDTWKKRGWCIVKKQVGVLNNKNQIIMRDKWTTDDEIPIFTENREYVSLYTQNEEELAVDE